MCIVVIFAVMIWRKDNHEERLYSFIFKTFGEVAFADIILSFRCMPTLGFQAERSLFEVICNDYLKSWARAYVNRKSNVWLNHWTKLEVWGLYFAKSRKWRINVQTPSMCFLTTEKVRRPQNAVCRSSTWHCLHYIKWTVCGSCAKASFQWNRAVGC